MIHNVIFEVAAIVQAAEYSQIAEKLVVYQLVKNWMRREPDIEPSMMADTTPRGAIGIETILGNTIEIATITGVEYRS